MPRRQNKERANIFRSHPYGAILSKIMDSLDEEKKFIIYSFIAIIISILGSIFSILWIKMGKGSKAWYEIYEAAISALGNNAPYIKEEVSKIAGFNYSSIPGFKATPQDNSIISTKGGSYSVSRINIGIGQVFYFLWVLIGLAHLVVGSIKVSVERNSCCLGILAILVGILLMLIVNLIFIHTSRFKSEILSDYYS